MISIVCFAVLAILARANAYSIACNCDCDTVKLSESPVCLPSYIPSLSCGSTPISLPSFDLDESLGTAQTTERVDRNQVYSVSLDNNGPCSIKYGPVVRSQKSAPLIEKPTITLPARIPGPRTVSNKCQCVKTIVKPQLYEQLITVPFVQRYIQTTHRPVVEKIHYQAVPVNAEDNLEVISSEDCAQVQTAPVVAVEAQPIRVSVPNTYVPVEIPSCSDEAVEVPCYEQVAVRSCY